MNDVTRTFKTTLIKLSSKQLLAISIIDHPRELTIPALLEVLSMIVFVTHLLSGDSPCMHTKAGAWP